MRRRSFESEVVLFDAQRCHATIRTVAIFQLPGGELRNRELAAATIRTVVILLVFFSAREDLRGSLRRYNLKKNIKK